MALRLIRPVRHADHRGWFSETWSPSLAARLGGSTAFVQDNLSFSRVRGTVRGLHFQRPPAAQAKLVTCLKGRILDCVVDIRTGSPTWGRHVLVELTETGEHLFVPEGFAHGFVTLTDDALVSYKVSAPFDREAEGGVAWNDPALGIDWPVPPAGPVVSDRDAALGPLSSAASGFVYAGDPMALTEV